MTPCPCSQAACSPAQGCWIGRAPPRRRTPAPRLACSCEHTPGSHDEQKGRCRAQVERPHYSERGVRSGYEYVLCPCMVYDGPEPLASFTARGLALPPVEGGG